MVNITPLSGAKGSSFDLPNVNPAMNEVDKSVQGTVQVMNVLNAQASNMLEQLALADTGLLEGLPGSMFDWGEQFYVLPRPPEANSIKT